MYTIEIERRIKLNITLDYILKHKSNPSLFIYAVCPSTQRVKKCTYEEFCQLLSQPRHSSDLASVIESESEESAGDSIYMSEEEIGNTSTSFGTMDKLKFLNTASSLLKPFDGKSDELDSFIRNINLIQQVADGDLKPFFLEFVKGRITGTVGNACSSAISIDQLISTLRSTVKSESPRVVESRLDALYFDHRNLSEFSAEAEKIGNKYLDALVNEGCSRQFATQLTINKIVEICRKSARNDNIKCILASSTYQTHVDVLTKFRTEISSFKKENQQRTSTLYNNNQTRYNNNNRNGFNNNNQQTSQVPRSTHQNPSNNFNNNRNQVDNNNRPLPRLNNNPRVHVLNQDSENDEATRWSPSEMEADV